MKSPQGYCLNRHVLRNCLGLREAVALCPDAPPRCTDIELLRRFEQAYRWWRTEILWPALAREKQGLHDTIDLDAANRMQPAGGPAPAPRGAGQEPRTPGALPGDAPASRGERRAPAPGADRDGDREAGGRGAVPAILTTDEVAALARVGVATVRRAVHETRRGLRGPGSPWFLPRAFKVRAGFLRADVLAWLEARGQVMEGKSVWSTNASSRHSAPASTDCAPLPSAAVQPRPARAG